MKENNDLNNIHIEENNKLQPNNDSNLGSSLNEKTYIKEHKSNLDEDNELNNLINHFSNAIDRNPSLKYSFKGNNEEYKLYSKKEENILQKNKGIFILSQSDNQKRMLFSNNLLKIKEISSSWIGSKRAFNKTLIHIAFNNSFSYYSNKNRIVKMREISFILEATQFKYYPVHTKESINSFTISPNRDNDKINVTDSDIHETSKELINAKKNYPHNKHHLHNHTKFTTDHNISSNLDQTEYEKINDVMNKDLPFNIKIRNDKEDNQFDNLFNPFTRNTDIKLPKIKNKNGTLKDVAVIFPQEISYQAKKEEIINQKSEFINFYNNLLNERSFAYQNSYYLNGMKNLITRRRRLPVSNSLSMQNIISEFSNYNKDYVNRLMSPKLGNEIEEPTIYDLKRIIRDRKEKSTPGIRSKV